MEEKFNNATPQRPTGSRPLDAEVIPINIPKYISQIKEESPYKKNGKNAITVFKSDQVTITIIVLKEGSEFHPGNDENQGILSLQVINGEILFKNSFKTVALKDGELLTLHEQLSFKAIAKMETTCLLTVFK